MRQIPLLYAAIWLAALLAVLVVGRFARGRLGMVIASIAWLLIVGAGAFAAYLYGEGRALVNAYAWAPFVLMATFLLRAVYQREYGATPVSALEGFDRGGVDLAVAISTWLTRVAQKNPSLPDRCRALVIGFSESGLGYEGYVTGTDRYDLSDPDWAVDARFRFAPTFLDSLSPESIAKPDYQSRVLEAVTSIAAEGSNPLLRAAPHISVGFDDLHLEHVR